MKMDGVPEGSTVLQDSFRGDVILSGGISWKASRRCHVKECIGEEKLFLNKT